MTFLIDPPLLVGLTLLSFWIGRKAESWTRAPVGRILGVFSLCVIIFTSTSLYLNMPFMDWLWLPFYPEVTSGRDLMINSGLFGFESTNTAGFIDAISALQVMFYILWSYLGFKLWTRIGSKEK